MSKELLNQREAPHNEDVNLCSETGIAVIIHAGPYLETSQDNKKLINNFEEQDRRHGKSQKKKGTDNEGIEKIKL
ncbi:hypothetical protein MAR_001548 [Mya arenaria]|uniref:Uncharacterized protein n=1 Tax=Mya arenaria TaxID=6604 RepID=A0ABY7FC93_MYAAR|nr:hypothetical protein MAR_001548 [Mya arenaria]